jgi:uncharacterized protein YbjT (DUF2867 family)
MIIILAGATGLVGGKILDLLLKDPEIESITAFARKKQEISNPKLSWVIGDLPPESIPKADALIMAIGTTIAKAGSKGAFFQTDVEIPYKLAVLTKNAGVSQVLNVSAKGANLKSSIFYNRAKAELEKRLIDLNFNKTIIIRPSLLLGERKENRPGEKIGQWIFRNLNFLFPKSIQAVSAEAVAMTIVRALLSKNQGLRIIENQEIFS